MDIRDQTGGVETVGAPGDAFRFGKNWQRFVAGHLDPDRERLAAESLSELVGDVRGKRFIDVGSGSGLFSLCAFRAGAAEIVSVDVDADSAAATERMRSGAGSPQNWKVIHGSILDERLVDELLPGDIVYSWGVLHHTGDMYRAISNAARLVSPGGLFAIAIYNRVSDRWLNSDRWWRIKRSYNHSPRLIQAGMEYAFGLYWLLACIRDGRNPIREARAYRSRGMALWTDLVDWIGGYPYEYATVEEITEFCQRDCGLRRVRVRGLAPHDTGNNEFVFRRVVR